MYLYTHDYFNFGFMRLFLKLAKDRVQFIQV